ncbi:MAG: NAD(P)-binding domain-containing protein [Spirochaetales bacterium]|nr:NAD(P)-binding domain-containing protein [Spirochaetales bacterium]
MRSATLRRKVYDVVVVGGGAAGVGVAVALRHAGIENFLVVERHTVGASFILWPDETRFITPSFATNSIGMLDLNSVAIGSSPAHVLEVEHPTGKEYAFYLHSVARFFELPVRQHTHVLRVAQSGNLFRIETNHGLLRAKHVIWAAGEFQYPRLNGFRGSELCRHTATVRTYGALDGTDFIVIGGYESGVDAAYNLAHRNGRVRLFDKGCPWAIESSDPSVALSTYSLQRMREDHFAENVELFPYASVESVERTGAEYEVTAQDGRRFQSAAPPLLAGGFEGGHPRIGHLFELRDDGFPLLSNHDESTIVPGVFLCGPSVRHDNHVFCFIYKYRQRFAVVAKAVATSLALPAKNLEAYRDWGMYLDDLSCCGHECRC